LLAPSSSQFDPNRARAVKVAPKELMEPERLIRLRKHHTEVVMSFGKGALLWLIGIPLPIILLLALFMHH
jgi:hypothetical protein